MVIPKIFAYYGIFYSIFRKCTTYNFSIPIFSVFRHTIRTGLLCAVKVLYKPDQLTGQQNGEEGIADPSHRDIAQGHDQHDQVRHQVHPLDLPAGGMGNAHGQGIVSTGGSADAHALVPVIVGFLSYFGMMLDYKPSFERTVQTTKDLNDAAVEYIDGIEVIKAFGKTESSYAKFTKAAMAYADSFISWMKRCSIFHGLMMVVTPYTLLTVLPFGAHYVANGTLAISDFVICIILSLGIVGPLITVGSYTDDLGKIGVIVGEVAGILEQPELERPEKSKSVPKDNSVTLEDVRFGYHDKEILHGVTMELKAGTVNAIVGPSGSGKSTIAKLIASLWDVDSGSIKIGGVDVKELAFADFNRKIAYVAQDNYLFNETVRENIRQGNSDATDEQIIEVTKKSGCYEFIMQLENGFDTVVGGAGGHLSGGERQRISIARAMLKDAPIVILDEATAYTDPENEAILQNSIAKLVAGKTLIVIAHRLSTVKDSDQIFVVNDGNVTAHGTHEELLVSCPLYKEMWNAHISVKDTVKEGE